ncbi:MAG: dihydroneopterin aldolase [Acidobacteriota bacterium]
MRRTDCIVLKGVRLPARGGSRTRVRRVDVRLWLDLMPAARHNRIDRTVDYREVHQCLRDAAGSGSEWAADLARVVLERFLQVDSVEVRSAGTRCPAPAS